jgi:hypothetical protein
MVVKGGPRPREKAARSIGASGTLRRPSNDRHCCRRRPEIADGIPAATSSPGLARPRLNHAHTRYTALSRRSERNYLPPDPCCSSRRQGLQRDVQPFKTKPHGKTHSPEEGTFRARHFIAKPYQLVSNSILQQRSFFLWSRPMLASYDQHKETKET